MAIHHVLLNLVCLPIIVSVPFTCARGGSILLKNNNLVEGEDGYNWEDLIKKTNVTVVVLVSIK